MGSQARAYHLQLTHFARAQVAFNTPTITTGLVVGHLPQGARVLRTHTIVETAGSTGATVSVGFIAENQGQPVAAITPQTQLVNAQAATATGMTTAAPTGLNGVLASDMALVMSMGGTPTAGVVTVIVEYVPNLG